MKTLPEWLQGMRAGAPSTTRTVWVAGLLAAACAPASLVDIPAPSGIIDPTAVQTPSGATQLYNNAITKYAYVLGGFNDAYVPKTGLLTDELMASGGGANVFDLLTWNVPSGASTTGFYALYQQPRVQARQAREALQAYAPSLPTPWQGRLYAVEAYSVLLFAEFYCSGIPMSTVKLNGEATVTGGLTTQELFAYAAALFDTAITLSGDTVRFAFLAKVGKGRALLGLGRFADAAAAVQDVPTTFVYNAEHGASGSLLSNIMGNLPRLYFVQDNEGSNGLVWSTDPRTAITTTPSLSGAMKYSAKYSRTSAGVLDPTQTIADNPMRVADGLEARLIEAEADLAANGTNWLTILNTLRSACVGTAACAPVPGLTAVALPPLTDPGTASTRLNLIMRERAMWLYLTGHREGDLRRLAHIYQRNPATLWPIGTYSNPGFPPLIAASSANGQAYGNGFVMRPGLTGSLDDGPNPLYTGCVSVDP